MVKHTFKELISNTHVYKTTHHQRLSSTKIDTYNMLNMLKKTYQLLLMTFI